MSPNEDRPHVLVLPEDDANRQLANGFHLRVDWDCNRQMQVLRSAGGWHKVLDVFKAKHVSDMKRCTKRFMVLLIDFDKKTSRLDEAKAAIPEYLADRVFILGVWSEPEKLPADLGSYESLGAKLASDCREETDATWQHTLLRHNAGELDRLRQHVRPILFPSL